MTHPFQNEVDGFELDRELLRDVRRLLWGELDFVSEGLVLDSTGPDVTLYKMLWNGDKVSLSPWLFIHTKEELVANAKAPFTIDVEFVPHTMGSQKGMWVGAGGTLYLPFRV